MRILKSLMTTSILASSLSLGVATSAIAGEWDVWIDKSQGSEVTIATSFSGDALTEDTQLDLKVASAFKVVDIQTLVKGSVCGAFPEKGFIRAVPPSGAGRSLAKSASDTCIFTLKLTDKSALSRQAKNVVDVMFIECVSSTDGPQSCSPNIRTLNSSRKN